MYEHAEVTSGGWPVVAERRDDPRTDPGRMHRDDDAPGRVWGDGPRGGTRWCGVPTTVRHTTPRLWLADRAARRRHGVVAVAPDRDSEAGARPVRPGSEGPAAGHGGVPPALQGLGADELDGRRPRFVPLTVRLFVPLTVRFTVNRFDHERLGLTLTVPPSPPPPPPLAGRRAAGCRGDRRGREVNQGAGGPCADGVDRQQGAQGPPAPWRTGGRLWTFGHLHSWGGTVPEVWDGWCGADRDMYQCEPAHGAPRARSCRLFASRSSGGHRRRRCGGTGL